MKKEIVINYHMLESCNYKCHYCYASWDKQKEQNALYLDLHKTQKMLEDVYRYFSSLGYQSVRLTLAGGEPFLVKKLGNILKMAHSIGFRLSIITNGSGLKSSFTEKYIRFIDILGISLDSADEETMRGIGRCDVTQTVLSIPNLTETIRFARRLNPELQIKVNTVVNQFNYDENLTPLIRQIAPDRWKILRVLPVLKENTAISDLQFQTFIQAHQSLRKIQTIEDNNDMRGSYIMIDPKGRFFDNTQSGFNGYHYSDPIIEIGAEAAFSQVNFDLAKFCSRYQEPTTLSSAC